MPRILQAYIGSHEAYAWPGTICTYACQSSASSISYVQCTRTQHMLTQQLAARYRDSFIREPASEAAAPFAEEK